MRTFLLCMLAAAAALLPGCAGYQLGPVKPKITRDFSTIAVPTFTNDTLEPRIEVLVTNAVIKHLQQDGTFQVTSADKADVILKGTILELRRSRARSVRGNVVATREFVLHLRLRYELIERATGEVISIRNVTGNTSFFVGNDLQQDERQAIPLAALEAAEEITSQVTEGW
jgi:hypothetical protein